MAYEIAAGGDVKSLAGMPSRSGVVYLNSKFVAISSVTPIHNCLEANPARIWAIIQNVGNPLATLYFTLTGAAYIALPQYGSITIDKDLPWTGQVLAASPSGVAGTVCVLELSVATE